MLEETLESLSGRFKVDCFFGGRAKDGYMCLKLGRLIERCPEGCTSYEKPKKYPYKSWK